ncbi:MAG: hypothetical protein IT582_07325 [Opitutaceae bacterium]|nr:hypothetical protein [Opitutaceae bacterium]
MAAHTRAFETFHHHGLRACEAGTHDTGETRLRNDRGHGAPTRPPRSYAKQYRALSKFVTQAKE